MYFLGMFDMHIILAIKYAHPGLEICDILVANATMFSHLLPGFSCGSKHLLLPEMHGVVNLMHFCVMFVMRSSTQPKTTAA